MLITAVPYFCMIFHLPRRRASWQWKSLTHAVKGQRSMVSLAACARVYSFSLTGASVTHPTGKSLSKRYRSQSHIHAISSQHSFSDRHSISNRHPFSDWHSTTTRHSTSNGHSISNQHSILNRHSFSDRHSILIRDSFSNRPSILYWHSISNRPSVLFKRHSNHFERHSIF